MGLFDVLFKSKATLPKKQHTFDSLAKDINNEDEDIRERAARKLGNLGDPRAVKCLIPLIKNNDWIFRTDVVNALVKIGNAATIQPLIQVLEDIDNDISKTAAVALERYGGQDAQVALQRYYQAQEKKQRQKGAPQRKVQGQWVLTQQGQHKYCTQKANSLLQAAEILKKIDFIPQLTYYVVKTPDGSLGRDINGYYTEAPIKTENLIVESRCGKSEIVEFDSLTGFGDMYANQTTVANLKKLGEYAQLVLLMKCGNCGYESPVETQPGELVRECYSCGIKNSGRRGEINIFLGSDKVEI